MVFSIFCQCRSVGVLVSQHYNTSVVVLSVATLQQIWNVYACTLKFGKMKYDMKYYIQVQTDTESFKKENNVAKLVDLLCLY